MNPPHRQELARLQPCGGLSASVGTEPEDGAQGSIHQKARKDPVGEYRHRRGARTSLPGLHITQR
eukprot:8575280-Pyramimonas_sp.AAC.1